MSLVLDQQYAGMIAPYVRNFSKKPNAYNFSCPVCGDSVTNLSRARGYLYPVGDRLLYKCHNCPAGGKLLDLLKVVDNNLAEQYIIDKFQENQTDRPDNRVIKTPKFVRNISKNLIKVSSLPPFHPCKKYVLERKIPSDKHYLLYYTDDFVEFSAEVSPNTEIPVEYRKEPRLVIPLITETQEVAGYQGRTLTEGSNAKYLTVLYNEDNGKIFGLDRVDFNKKKYAFEGPLDALFIPNGIATTGGRIDTLLSHTSLDTKSTVIVYDNEPRSKHTVAKMDKALDSGFPVCIWPSELRQTDVNQMIMAGCTPAQVQAIIDKRTFSGLAGKLELATWRKI